MRARPRPAPVSRIQWRTGAPRSVSSIGRILDESRARARGFQGAHQVLGRIAGIEGRRDAAAGHDAQVGQVKLQARLGVEGHDVAFGQPQRAQAGGDFFGRRFQPFHEQAT